MGELHDRIEEIARELVGKANLLESLTPDYKEDFKSWLNANVQLGMLTAVFDPENGFRTVAMAAFIVGHGYALKYGDIKTKTR